MKLQWRTHPTEVVAFAGKDGRWIIQRHLTEEVFYLRGPGIIGHQYHPSIEAAKETAENLE